MASWYNGKGELQNDQTQTGNKAFYMISSHLQGGPN